VIRNFFLGGKKKREEGEETDREGRKEKNEGIIWPRIICTVHMYVYRVVDVDVAVAVAVAVTKELLDLPDDIALYG
jgi:hypothetical protein